MVLPTGGPGQTRAVTLTGTQHDEKRRQRRWSALTGEQHLREVLVRDPQIVDGRVEKSSVKEDTKRNDDREDCDDRDHDDLRELRLSPASPRTGVEWVRRVGRAHLRPELRGRTTAVLTVIKRRLGGLELNPSESV